MTTMEERREAVADTIRILQVGLGYIGLEITRILGDRGGYLVTGAVDRDPGKNGDDLGTLAGLDKPLPVRVNGSLDQALAAADAEVAILATGSRMEGITPLVLELIDHGVSVLSTCEELVYPWRSHENLARQIDAAARKQGVTVLATGVNPGFLMDFLPLVITRLAGKVDSLTVERVQDAGSRREAFQRKIGAGLSVEAFQERVAAGHFGHAGLVTSIELLAAGLGWPLDETSETIEPVLASTDLHTEFVDIATGQVAGVHQVGRGFTGGKEAITLNFRAAVGEARSFDAIRMAGSPPLEVTFPGGVPGDVATGAITVNAIPLLMQSPPGLRTMADLWAR